MSTLKTPTSDLKVGREEIRTCFLDNEKSMLTRIWDKFPSNMPEPFLAVDKDPVLTKAKQNCFDVVVSDNRMPEMSGVEVLSKIRSFNPDIILILYTGFVTRHDEIELCEENNIEIVKKIGGLSALFKKILFLFSMTSEQSELPELNFDDFDRTKKSRDVEVRKHIKTKDLDKVISDSQINYELLDTLKPLINELVDDLKSIPNKDALIKVGGKIYTINEMIRHVENLSPVGRLQIKYWFKGKAMINKHLKENE